MRGSGVGTGALRRPAGRAAPAKIPRPSPLCHPRARPFPALWRIPLRPDPTPALRRELPPRLDSLARLLDEAVRVPGTNVRFGLDSVLGLLPGAGDWAGAVLSALLVLEGARLGAPAPVIARMVLNVGIDALLGVVPLVGDLFDVGWKANVRNLALLRGALEAPGTARRSSAWVLAGTAAGLAAVLGGALWATAAVVGWLWSALVG